MNIGEACGSSFSEPSACGTPTFMSAKPGNNPQASPAAAGGLAPSASDPPTAAIGLVIDASAKTASSGMGVPFAASSWPYAL